jgi:transcriptional regulator with XRE-family HTH domain
MTDDIVAVLLGDAMPPERLGELLRAGRKRRGWKRKHAAAMVRISAERLRAYENGTETIPADVCALLAECYGEDLTAHVPLRVAPELDGTTLTVAGVEQTLADASEDEVVAGYVDIVQRLRRTKPGEPLPLRATDLTVIAAALESDADAIEQKIVEVLGCTRTEARSLHRELLRRRVVLPVAGLAASVVALAGVQVAHAMSNDTAPAPAPAPAPITVPGPVVAPPTTAITVAPPTTVVPHAAFTPPTTIAAPAAKPAAVVKPTAAPAPAPHVEETPVTVAATPPSIPDDDTPRGILPGEEPIHIETP